MKRPGDQLHQACCINRPSILNTLKRDGGGYYRLTDLKTYRCSLTDAHLDKCCSQVDKQRFKPQPGLENMEYTVYMTNSVLHMKHLQNSINAKWGGRLCEGLDHLQGKTAGKRPFTYARCATSWTSPILPNLKKHPWEPVCLVHSGLL